MAERIVRGLPYITEDYKLVQEITTFTEDSTKKVHEYGSIEVIVENIWEDLKKSSDHLWEMKVKGGRYKKYYFYWVVKVTEIGGDNDVEQHFDAPDPPIEVFMNLPEPEYDSNGKLISPDPVEPDLEISDSDSDWSKYWKEKMKTTIDNYEYKSAVTPKEDIIHSTTSINQVTEANEVIPEKRIEHPVDQTIETLINTLF